MGRQDICLISYIFSNIIFCTRVCARNIFAYVCTLVTVCEFTCVDNLVFAYVRPVADTRCLFHLLYLGRSSAGLQQAGTHQLNRSTQPVALGSLFLSP